MEWRRAARSDACANNGTALPSKHRTRAQKMQAEFNTCASANRPLEIPIYKRPANSSPENSNEIGRARISFGPITAFAAFAARLIVGPSHLRAARLFRQAGGRPHPYSSGPLRSKKVPTHRAARALRTESGRLGQLPGCPMPQPLPRPKPHSRPRSGVYCCAGNR
jgi:hypothetical protein